jgi:signal transduction histidine kinase
VEESRTKPTPEFEDGLLTVRSCDLVFGSGAIALAVVASIFAFRGRASLSTVALFWAFPILNVGWSAVTVHWDRIRAELIRSAANIPLVLAFYVLEDGPFHRLWIPALMLVVGVPAILGAVTKRPFHGYCVTAAYGTALFLTGWLVTGDPIQAVVPPFVGIVCMGATITILAAKLGASLGYARQRRLEAETQKERAETAFRELADAQEKLLSIARSAGMAEVAVSVLHDVGNALNSVNVSAQVTTETLRDSRLSSLTRAIQLLQSDDLAGFLDGPKGRVLPEYLLRTTEHVAAQLERAISELGALRSSVERINAIVATQQAYAEAAPEVSTFRAAEVVEAALRLNEASFGKNGITALRAVDDIRLTTDKHRVLQILVNLIANAREAVQPVSDRSRRIEVIARRNLGDVVRFEVRDNGVGIDPQTITHIFRHGFTTKPHRHGFGLHIAANTAQDLGGSLQAQSKGVGLGATFVLEVPANLDRKSATATANRESIAAKATSG